MGCRCDLNCRQFKRGMRLAATELTARRCTTRRTAGTLVLVAENQTTLFEIVGRHLDGHAVAGQRLDAVLLHLAGGVGDDLVSGVQLDPETRVRKDLGDETL